jgi:hypothetical protein
VWFLATEQGWDAWEGCVGLVMVGVRLLRVCLHVRSLALTSNLISGSFPSVVSGLSSLT